MVKQELLKVADVRAELALVAAEYVRRYHAKVDTSKARVELAKLRKSGLGDSLNAKKLESECSALDGVSTKANNLAAKLEALFE